MPLALQIVFMFIALAFLALGVIFVIGQGERIEADHQRMVRAETRLDNFATSITSLQARPIYKPRTKRAAKEPV